MIGRILNVLLRREAILTGFVLSPLLVGVVDALRNAPDWPLAWGSVAVFAVLAWLTHQGRGTANWVAVVLLLIEGSSLLYDGLTGVLSRSDLPVWLPPLLIPAGVYLTWGALVLHRSRPIRD